MTGRRVDFTPTGKPVTHNRSAYTNHGCRCDVCTEDWRLYCERRRVERYALEPHEHGKSTTYTNWGCRCFDCRKAHTADSRNRRHRVTN